MMYDEFRPGRNRIGLGDEEEQDEYRESILSQLGEEEEPRRGPVGPPPMSSPGGSFHTQVERDPVVDNIQDAIGPPEPSRDIYEPPGRDDPRMTYPEDPTRGQTPGQIDDELFGPEGPPERGDGPVRTQEGDMPPATAAGAMARGGGGQYRDYLEGFNFDKLDNPDRYTDANTSKYEFARIAENYDPGDPAALEKIVAELNAKGINAQYDGRDKVDFGDGYGYIDVWEDHVPGQGGRAWWWGAGAGAGTGGGGGEGGGVGGFAGGEGPASAGQAFSYLKSLVSPGASKDEMEAAIAAAFGNVPGFEEAYKESVKINGVWYDMVVGYDPGRGGSWTEGLSPKDGGHGASARGARPTSVSSLLGGGGLPSSGSGGRGPNLNAALQNSAVFEQIEEEIRRLIAGESPQNELLNQLGL